MNDETLYAVPARFRRLENLHIFFWLLKDISWCIGFKPLGVAMIFPTLIAALYITWRNKQIISELVHNLAVILWIIANSMWMIFEFMGQDEELKHWCIVPFATGLAILLYYYLIYVPVKRKRVRSTVAVTVPVSEVE